jgi:hypothetical protein
MRIPARSRNERGSPFFVIRDWSALQLAGPWKLFHESAWPKPIAMKTQDHERARTPASFLVLSVAMPIVS